MDSSDANCATIANAANERDVHGPLSLSASQWWCSEGRECDVAKSEPGARNAELEFFSVGQPAIKLEKNETIESPVAVTGGKKEPAPRPAPVQSENAGV